MTKILFDTEAAARSRGSARSRIPYFVAVAWLLLAISAAVSACALEKVTPTRSPGGVTKTPPSPIPTATWTPTAQQPVALSPTQAPPPPDTVEPTIEPGGRNVILTPAANDVGWWASDDSQKHIGDSFLYSGYYDNQVFISAMSFDLGHLTRGVPVRNASLQMTGLKDDRLAQSGQWAVQLLAAAPSYDLARADFRTLFNMPAGVTILPSLGAQSLHANDVNTFTFDLAARTWLQQQIMSGTTTLIARLMGPTGDAPSLFAWDSGAGPVTLHSPPRLALVLGPEPKVPVASPTAPLLVATFTATPANVLTAAAYAQRATDAARNGAPGALAYTIVTPTPGAPVVVPTPEPANPATADAEAAYATAVAVTTGTFTPIPTNAMFAVVVTPTPMPENVLTAAAQSYLATAAAQQYGTPPPLPANAVIATVTPGPVVVPNTPRPGNAATAQSVALYATAVAMTTGTFTPLPPYAVTPTPIPPTPLILYWDQMPPTPEITPTPTPGSQMPRALVGKILFRSDRAGEGMSLSFDPANGRLAYVTQDWPYQLALSAESRSPDGKFSLIVQNRDDTNERQPGVFVRDNQSGALRLLIHSKGITYDPVWSPRGDRIALVSTATGNDDIYTVAPDGSNLQRLTQSTWQWYKHPTYSPDGSQIVFWSNRDTGRRQLWIMNADGSNQHQLLASPGEDWDPVWVK